MTEKKDENEEYEVDPEGAMLHRMESETNRELLERVVKNFVLFRQPYAPEGQIPVGGGKSGSVKVRIEEDEFVEVHYELKTSSEPLDTEMSQEEVENSIIMKDEESNAKPSD